MIQFFRKIRRVLLNENKFTKYLLYAMGEISLVVIGILLALQINSWNEQQKRVKLAREYLINISYDLKKDTSDFQKSIKLINETIAMKTWGLKKQSFENVSVDTLNTLLINTSFELGITDITFQKIKNEEILGLNKFHKIFEETTQYYTKGKEWLDIYINWDVEGTSKEVEFWFLEQNRYETNLLENEIPIFQTQNERKKEIISTILSIQGRNYMKHELIRKKAVLNAYEAANEKAIVLLQNIEKELFLLDK